MGNHYEIMGQTHCDTIGDYFKNKYVFSIIQKWFRVKLQQGGIKNPGEIRVWKNRRNKDLGFTEEYEDFVRAIFQDKTDMEEFLSFLKAEYVDNERMKELLQGEFETGDFIRLFLSFRELADQLHCDQYDRIQRLTIGSIFSTRIAYILEKAHSTDVSYTNDTTIHRSMEEIYENGISPISEGGKILCYLDRGEQGGYEVKELLQNENITFEVKSNGSDILDADDFIKEKGEDSLNTEGELELYIKYSQFHNDIDSIELSEEEEDGYYQERIDWEAINKGKSQTEKEIAFKMYLVKKIKYLEGENRKNARVVDIQGNPIKILEQTTIQDQYIPEGFQLYSVPNL